MSSDLKAQIKTATDAAMRARERTRLGALRLINAEIKQIEVDERKELEDQDVLAILNRMLKQRRDSLSQYESAGRDDLAAQESFEIDLIHEFMPAQMTEDEIAQVVQGAIAAVDAQSMRDMGKVMGRLKGELTGKADMSVVSRIVKTRLGE